MKIEERLRELNMYLPEPTKAPATFRQTFPFVRVHDNRAYVSGHGPTNPDGTLAQVLGKVGAEVTQDQAYAGGPPHRASYPRKSQTGTR